MVGNNKFLTSIIYYKRKDKQYFHKKQKMQANRPKKNKGGRELCRLPAKKYEKEKDCLACAFAIYD